MDRLEALGAFVTIAERGSFAAAAREHRVSPQAITRAIAALEHHLGGPLFHRSTRSVRLTDAGASFLPRCRQILYELKDAEQSLKGSQAAPRGSLSITSSVMFGRMHVVPVVVELLERFPQLSVRLILVDRFVQLVDEGVDVAVRLGDLADSALRAIKVGEVRRVLVASPAYLDRRGSPAAPADLKEHDVIAFTGVSAGDVWKFGPRGRTTVRVQPRLVVNSADAALAAARAGAGVCRILSYQASAEIADKSLRVLLREAEPPPMPVNIVFLPARAASANVRAFVDLARSRLKLLDF